MYSRNDCIACRDAIAVRLRPTVVVIIATQYVHCTTYNFPVIYFSHK